jgi:hypothetical protein
VTNTVTYAGTPTLITWDLTLPAGWTFVSDSGSVGDVQPVVGAAGAIAWQWSTTLGSSPSPITFKYVVNVPYGSTGTQSYSALVSVTEGTVTQVNASSDPLAYTLSVFHSADEAHAGALNLSDLTRVIELYNTHFGSIRTGCYTIDETSEDGFNPDTTRSTSAAFALPYYHAADETSVGNLTLSELTRVIELYNFHAGSIRTGAYSVAVGTEDGFQPGP